MDPRPIGMFDSGFGGLTVARAAIDLLPAEDLVYLGDTGRYPYGCRELAEVETFAVEIADHLVARHDVKLLVVACNTATAAALVRLTDQLPVPVVGVIEPGVRATLQVSQRRRVAVLGTTATIGSRSYETAFGKLDPDVELTSVACPGFVELVERGEATGDAARVLVEERLGQLPTADIDALLLGCTHYPFLARTISDVVGPDVVLVSSADETAFALAAELERRHLRHPEPARLGRHRFLSSGDVREFVRLGSTLLGPELADAERWEPDAT